MKHDIFISYSRRDSNEVKALKSHIERHIPHIRMWFDETGIESGDEFQDKIVDAIDNCEVVLFMLSENSLNSEWTKDEVMYAKNTSKRIIPVLLKGAVLKGWFLFRFGRVDYIDSTVEAQVQKLVSNLAKSFPAPQNDPVSQSSQNTSSAHNSSSNNPNQPSNQSTRLDNNSINDNTNKNCVGGVPKADSNTAAANTQFTFDKDYASYDLVLKHPGENKLLVAKLIKEITGLYLKEIKDMVDYVPSLVKHGLSKTEAQSLLNRFEILGADIDIIGKGLIDPKTKNTAYDIVLTNPGKDKLQVVRLIKEVKGLGLKESKELADYAPTTVISNLPKAEAESLKKEFEAIGATINLIAKGQEAAEEKANYDLILKNIGKDKLKVVKLINEITKIGLKESKELADWSYQGPVLVKKNLSKAEAESYIRQFEAIGASVYTR